jgi:hypothetical protein
MRALLYVCLTILLCGCALTAREEAVDWNSIDYVSVACKGRMHEPGCKVEEEDIASGKRGKGR